MFQVAEKHDDKKHRLIIPYQGEKGEQVIRSARTIVKRLLPSNRKVQVPFTGDKLSSCFNFKDKPKFEHRHYVIYFGTCPESCVMIITLVNHNNEFLRGLKTTTA